MTQREENLTTIEVAWAHYIPWKPIPCLKHRCSWLSAIGGKIEPILSLIEQVSKRGNIADPEGYVWKSLRRVDVRSGGRNRAMRVWRPAA